MKRTVLIDEASIAAETVGLFSIGDGKTVSAFQDGLAGAEEIEIQQNVAGAGDSPSWTVVTYKGVTQVLDPDNTRVIVRGPGFFRMMCDSAAGAVVAGVEGD